MAKIPSYPENTTPANTDLLIIDTPGVATKNIKWSTIKAAFVNIGATISGALITGDIPGNAQNVNGIVAVVNGGTNANNATSARTNLSAAQSGANNDITSLAAVTTPLTVAQGGTNANNATSARSNLSAAQSGANNDITSLAAVTTPMTIAQGGTNASTAANARTNLGLGTAATQNIGTSPSNVVQLDGSSRLPSVDGSLLTNLPSSQTQATTSIFGISRLGNSTSLFIGNPTITIASPAVITITGHGLAVNDTVVFTTTGALPTGITASTTYFVISAGLTSNAFEISATQGGSAINTSGTQSGTHTCTATSAILAKNPTISIFTSSGSYTPATGARYIKIRAQGGGGGGGGSSSSGNTTGGGGAGGYVEKIFLTSSLTFPQSVSVGSAGSAGSSSGGTAGGNGGNTTFSTITSSGGSGGQGSATGFTTYAAGGNATGGDINIVGGKGGSAINNFSSTSANIGGQGGSSPLGMGSPFSTSIGGGPTSPSGYGAGGTGMNGSSSGNGSAGTAGILTIEEY